MGRELPENESQDPVPLAEVRFAKEVRHNYESRSLPEGAQEVTMAENDVAEKQRRRERAKLQDAANTLSVLAKLLAHDLATAEANGPRAEK